MGITDFFSNLYDSIGSSFTLEVHADAPEEKEEDSGEEGEEKSEDSEEGGDEGEDSGDEGGEEAEEEEEEEEEEPVDPKPALEEGMYTLDYTRQGNTSWPSSTVPTQLATIPPL
jgi:hypothetical protein